MKLISLSPFISLVLVMLLVVAPLSAQTPVPPADSPGNSSLVETLQLRIVDSDGAEISAGSKAVKGFTVEVKDSAGNAVAGAAVALRLPDTGASGTFPDGTHAAVAYTDSQGLAHVGALQWNATPGAIAMRVTATKGTAHAGILIEQTLTATAQPTVPALPRVSVEPEAAVPPVLVAKAPATPQQPGALASPGIAPVSAAAQQPAVSVTGSGQATTPHSKAKWIAIVAVIAGAGAGAAMALGKGKSNSSAPAPSAVSIGSPSISVGAGH